MSGRLAQGEIVLVQSNQLLCCVPDTMQCGFMYPHIKCSHRGAQLFDSVHVLYVTKRLSSIKESDDNKSFLEACQTVISVRLSPLYSSLRGWKSTLCNVRVI